MATTSLGEGISHTAAKNQVVHLVHEVFDDTDLGRNLGTTHDGSEGTLDVVEHVVNGLHFLLHEIAQHLVVSIEAVGNHGSGSVAAVSRTESVVHIDVGIRSEHLGKLLLAFLHGLLGVGISGIFLVNAYGLAFFFRIETEVLQQEHFAGLQGCSSLASLGAVGSKLNLHAEVLAHSLHNLLQGELRVHLSFGLAHVAHDDQRTAVGQHLLQCGQRTTDTGIVGNFTIFIKRHVEVHTDNHFLALKIASFNSHNDLFI